MMTDCMKLGITQGQKFHSKEWKKGVHFQPIHRHKRFPLRVHSDVEKNYISRHRFPGCYPKVDNMTPSSPQRLLYRNFPVTHLDRTRMQSKGSALTPFLQLFPVPANTRCESRAEVKHWELRWSRNLKGERWKHMIIWLHFLKVVKIFVSQQIHTRKENVNSFDWGGDLFVRVSVFRILFPRVSEFIR